MYYYRHLYYSPDTTVNMPDSIGLTRRLN
ncbi:hypothetical protein [Serratia sp. 3ACOL1]